MTLTLLYHLLLLYYQTTHHFKIPLLPLLKPYIYFLIIIPNPFPNHPFQFLPHPLYPHLLYPVHLKTLLLLWTFSLTYYLYLLPYANLLEFPNHYLTWMTTFATSQIIGAILYNMISYPHTISPYLLITLFIKNLLHTKKLLQTLYGSKLCIKNS